MKVKVLEKFIDKNTRDHYEIGQEIEVTKKRFEEMNSTEFGKLVEEIEEVKEKKSTTKK